MQAETEVIPSEHESFKWLLEALCDELVEVHGDPANEDASWIRVVTDSRIVRAGDVFVALSGERTDGHRYLSQAAESGAFCLVVEHVETGLNVPQLVVENSRRAYGLIARAWRRRFGIALTAVGGSNGKTTTTQMMKAILAKHPCYGRQFQQRRRRAAYAARSSLRLSGCRCGSRDESSR